jgi:hypothetical protein
VTAIAAVKDNNWLLYLLGWVDGTLYLLRLRWLTIAMKRQCYRYRYSSFFVFIVIVMVISIFYYYF